MPLRGRSRFLFGADPVKILNRLSRNTTDVPIYSDLDLTSCMLVANLPAEVAGILWCVSTRVKLGPTGTMPQDLCPRGTLIYHVDFRAAPLEVPLWHEVCSRRAS